MIMFDGYAYESSSLSLDSEDWEIVVYTLDGGESYVSTIRIDGSPCAVFYCADGVYRAQLAHMCAYAAQRKGLGV